ncbi:MAG: citrate synthase [Candidatus Omnitrophica bacterium]|nr:citrate synthase [Candidatus Omnitrophota bacterium]
MDENAKLSFDGKTIELPIITGTEGEKGLDISKLRKETGYITVDPGFSNTGSCTSAITYIDGEKGILRHRGIPIEQLAEKSTFVETAYLVIHDRLPLKEELEFYSKGFTKHSMIHEDMKTFFRGYPQNAHPMAILSAMVCSLSCYYPEFIKAEPTDDEIENIAIELMAKVRTIAAYTYKKSIGEPFVYPRADLRYVANFMHMMFSSPVKEYKIDPEIVKALETLFILHVDHEQNCSTSTVRLVGSSRANLFASVSSAICALWGPLHGGANQKVVEMLQRIHDDGGDVDKYIAKAKDKNSSFRLMGFGHRVYKNFDPRALLIKDQCKMVLDRLGIHDPLLDIAVKLQEKALKDDYFKERKLYPNVDFYSGIIYKAVGIPLAMFPVLFAIGRMPGWIAQWKEMIESPCARIGRPRQIYTGENKRDYIPMEKRS